MNRPVRLIGLPTDSQRSSPSGAAAAPTAIRAALASDHVNMAAEHGLEIGIDVALEHDGDLPLTEGDGAAASIRAAFAPGVSHHKPGGLSVGDVLNALHRVRTPLVGADIAELNPSRDVDGVAATLAAGLVKELAALSQEGRA